MKFTAMPNTNAKQGAIIEKDYSIKINTKEYQAFLNSEKMISFSEQHADDWVGYIQSQMGSNVVITNPQNDVNFLFETFFKIKLSHDVPRSAISKFFLLPPSTEKFNKTINAIQDLVNKNADIFLRRFMRVNFKFFTTITTDQIKEFLEYLCSTVAINKNSNNNEPEVIEPHKISLKCFILKMILMDHKVAQHFLGYNDRDEKDDNYNKYRYINMMETIFQSNNSEIIDTFLSNLKYAYDYELSTYFKNLMKNSFEIHVENISNLNLSTAAKEQLAKIGITSLNSNENTDSNSVNLTPILKK